MRKNTTNDMQALDIRYLQRQGLLMPGRTSSLTWSRSGTVIASIQITTHANWVILQYRHQRHNEPWQNLDYPVYLEKTNCNMDGQRTWFLCPTQGCDKRVAVIYGGKTLHVDIAINSPMNRPEKNEMTA